MITAACLLISAPVPGSTSKNWESARGEEVWSARVTLKYRALAVKLADDFVWFWIGEHNVYDAMAE